MLLYQSGLEHGLCKFLDKQRYAVGLGNDLLHDNGGQRLPTGDRFDNRFAVSTPKPVEHESRYLWMIPGDFEVGAICCD